MCVLAALTGYPGTLAHARTHTTSQPSRCLGHIPSLSAATLLSVLAWPPGPALHIAPSTGKPLPPPPPWVPSCPGNCGLLLGVLLHPDLRVMGTEQKT